MTLHPRHRSYRLHRRCVATTTTWRTRMELVEDTRIFIGTSMCVQGVALSCCTDIFDGNDLKNGANPKNRDTE